jgi:hypothetical protein
VAKPIGDATERDYIFDAAFALKVETKGRGIRLSYLGPFQLG